MFEYGLKLWSTNAGYANSAVELFGRGIYHYLELFAVPGSYGTLGTWKALAERGIPFVIHAPHTMAGLNLADPAARKQNKVLAAEAFRFADGLKAPKVIFHPGVNGSDEEAAVQLKGLADGRVLVENKPYLGIVPGAVCAGYSPEGIKAILNFSGAGFCLDTGHAIAAANAVKTDKWAGLAAFFALGPQLFHISDGDQDGTMDSHLHLGKGSYDFARLVKLIPAGARITLETEKNYPDRLDDFAGDVRFMAGLVAGGRP
ncbi:MAG: TIM barrel protein [Elusimicrobiales bacterium]|nr:TIM barrel protein [Elusimicrobiales bacterium]